MNRALSLLLVGAGSRGMTYTREAVGKHGARVVGIAEPREQHRMRAAAEFEVTPERCVESWEDFPDAQCKGADAVIIATPERFHTGPALRFIGLGLPVLLEKPMAPSEEEAKEIVVSSELHGVLVCVAHVMRYLPYTRQLKALVESGKVGDIMSLEHLEPVGWWHFAHSFVRGNWRREDLSGSMLLTKSCHDIDWLSFVVGQPPVRVSSFGSLSHFKKENKPLNASDRCLDCQVEHSCPYSAKRTYLETLGDLDGREWARSVLTLDLTPEGVRSALRTGPYGRCVYDCDNDVVDHQVVIMEFANEITASFTMTAFTPMSFRKTRIFGTRGSIEGDGQRIRAFDFLSQQETVIDCAGTNLEERSGHLGSDAILVRSFLEAVASGDRSLISSSARESFRTHQIVWAAERARSNGTVEVVAPNHGYDRVGAASKGAHSDAPAADVSERPSFCKGGPGT